MLILCCFSPSELKLSTALKNANKKSAAEALKGGSTLWQPEEAATVIEALTKWPHDPDVVFFAAQSIGQYTCIGQSVYRTLVSVNIQGSSQHQ